MAKQESKPIEGETWSLAEFVEDFEEQLKAIQRRNRKGVMALTEVSLTLGVTATKSAEGGVDLKVLQVKGGVSRADERTITVKFEVLKDSVITEAHGDADIEQAILEAELSDHAMSHVRRAAKKRAPARKAAKRAPAKKAVSRRVPDKKTAWRAPARKAAKRG